jgi:prepilin-type N-terminal cleavage/methylation domain-containing protein
MIFYKPLRVRKGFTLIELIVVIAVLAIIAGVTIPLVNNYISNANSIVAKSNGLNAFNNAKKLIIVGKNSTPEIIYNNETILDALREEGIYGITIELSDGEISRVVSSHRNKEWTYTPDEGWIETD